MGIEFDLKARESKNWATGLGTQVALTRCSIDG